MTPETDQTSSRAAGDRKAGTKESSQHRAGVPVWRTGKPDAFLASAVDAARAALEGIAPAEQIGRHLAAKSEGDRLVTHLFESKLAGYGGWQWYAVLTRNSRSKVVTVDELGLLPSDDSILAPEWVPWAERVRPGDEQGEEELAEAVSPAPLQDAGEPEAAEAAGDARDARDAGSESDEAPEDDSDDADGNADGAGDEYDADDVDDDDEEDSADSEESEEGPADELPTAQAD